MKKIQKIILAFMLGIVPIQVVWADDALIMALVEGGDALKSLVEQGADIESRDNKLGVTALIAASIIGDLESVKYLISKGAKINAKNDDGVTALMSASLMGHTNIAKYLISKNADLNIKDKKFGATALMYASSKGLW